MEKENLVRVLEVGGGFLLLFSFIVQNYAYDLWTDRSNELEAAMLEQAVVGKSVQLNELLYFSALADQNEPQDFRLALSKVKIGEAAAKLFMSQSIPISVSDLSKGGKEEAMTRLAQGLEGVHDYASFNAYRNSVNRVTSTIEPPVLILQKVNRSRAAARRWFLALYVVGAASLLSGVAMKPD
jgi:tRNA U38,U39,U40 pseudouridine synthase TruA